MLIYVHSWPKCWCQSNRNQHYHPWNGYKVGRKWKVDPIRMQDPISRDKRGELNLLTFWLWVSVRLRSSSNTGKKTIFSQISLENFACFIHVHPRWPAASLLICIQVCIIRQSHWRNQHFKCIWFVAIWDKQTFDEFVFFPYTVCFFFFQHPR